MEPFRTLTAVAAPLDGANVDTDQILPARFMRRKRSGGFQDYLFRDLRFADDGAPDPAFVLNRVPWDRARILVADRNFGGGSSREQAVWALVDFGITCVVASSFGEIFYNNAFKNGLLPVRLDDAAVKAMRASLHAEPGATITVDLEAQTVTAPDGGTHAFEVPPFRKRTLMLGLDDIGVTLESEAEITAFEKGYRRRRPWLFATG